MAKGSDNEFPSVLVKEGTVPTSPAAGDQRLYLDTADHKFKRVNSSGTITTIESSGSGLYAAYLCYRDEKTTSTDGGTFTSGAWQTRVLNVEHADTVNHGTLASNQITLDAGTYRVLIHAPAYAVGVHQAKLYNVTDSADLLLGQSMYAPASPATMNLAVVAGRFTIAGSKVLEARHRCQTTEASNGFGVAGGFGTEVYTTVELFKE